MTTILSRSRLQEILDSYRSLKIAVLGDFALDAYWYVDLTKAELSRETPLFNRPVVRESYSLGGSANVAWNIADLGVKQVRAFSALGDDWRGTMLRDLLTQAGIRSEDCLPSPAWSTILFAKVFLSANGQQQEDSRFDFVNEHQLSLELETALLKRLEDCLPEMDALVISDYQTMGVISPAMVDRLNSLAEKFPRTLFLVDSRARIGQFRNMIIKPNKLEAFHAWNNDPNEFQVNDNQLVEAGRCLQKQANKPVFITLGEEGCLVIDEKANVKLPALRIPPPIDPVGAGDTFLASLTASLAANASLAEAAIIANLAAGVVIRKLNITGTASPGEIVMLYDEFQKDGLS